MKIKRIAKKMTNILSAKQYTQFRYFSIHHKFPDLKHPKTYNEKLLWMKLYDYNPKYNIMVDKYDAKKYVADIIGEEHIIPTYGVWDSFDDIDFESLPNEFVLKTTHDCGGIYVCKDKTQFNREEAKKFIDRHLKYNYYWQGREWPYKDIKHRVIAEAYMTDESGYELKDYKFFCFNGNPEIMFIASDRMTEGEETKFDFFDMSFNHLPFRHGHPNSNKTIYCPPGFDEMKKLAGDLSQGIPQLRVDFYNINGQIYFGELTLFHWGGMMPFDPPEWDYKLGEMIKLPIDC